MSSRKSSQNQSWNMAKEWLRTAVTPHQRSLAAYILTVAFIHAQMKRRREPPCTSLSADLSEVSLFQLPDLPNAVVARRMQLWVHESLRPVGDNILYSDTSFIFPPTFQLVKLDLGCRKPAHLLQRRMHYETIIIG